jgi:hypothetical protein
MKEIGYAILTLTLLFVWLGDSGTIGDMFAKAVVGLVGTGLGVLFLYAANQYTRLRR